jgi:cob(I)alamin adenosyltransferase
MTNEKTYRAADIAEDLSNLGDEIANDTERTLDETNPRDFRHEDWEAMREAIKAMRERLDEMEEMIDRAETEADEYDEETSEDRYETYWA